jgi:HEAT repeat protein
LLGKLPDLAVAWQRGAAAGPELLAALESANAAERFWGVFGLGQRADDSVAPQLQARLKDETPAVRLAAAWSLHRLGKTDAVSLDALRLLLRSRRPIVLLETLQIVHHLGPAAAALEPELERLGKTKAPPLYARQIGYAAEFALKAIRHP